MFQGANFEHESKLDKNLLAEKVFCCLFEINSKGVFKEAKNSGEPQILPTIFQVEFF